MAKFVVEEVGDGMVTLRVKGMNYRNVFQVQDAAGLVVGERVKGEILPAWKVDRVEMGGNYVEPLEGRPRRMQGMVVGVDAGKNELRVQVGYEVVVKFPAKYKAGEYAVGERVGWDNVEVPEFRMLAGGVIG